MNCFRTAVALGVLSVASFAPVAASAQTAISGSEDVVVLPDTQTREEGGIGGGSPATEEVQGVQTEQGGVNAGQEVGGVNAGQEAGGVGGGEEVLGETVTRGLAVTGGDVLGLAAMASAAVAAGGAALTVRRRRQS